MIEVRSSPINQLMRCACTSKRSYASRVDSRAGHGGWTGRVDTDTIAPEFLTAHRQIMHGLRTVVSGLRSAMLTSKNRQAKVNNLRGNGSHTAGRGPELWQMFLTLAVYCHGRVGLLPIGQAQQQATSGLPVARTSQRPASLLFQQRQDHPDPPVAWRDRSGWWRSQPGRQEILAEILPLDSWHQRAHVAASADAALRTSQWRWLLISWH